MSHRLKYSKENNSSPEKGQGFKFTQDKVSYALYEVWFQIEHLILWGKGFYRDASMQSSFFSLGCLQGSRSAGHSLRCSKGIGVQLLPLVLTATSSIPVIFR